jgi:hypothetical protein
MTAPKGMIGILTDETGRVVATEADFDTSGSGGFTNAQAQKLRLKGAVAYVMMRAYCSPVVVKAMSSYRVEELMDELCRNHGFRLTWKAIGHDPEDVE